MVDRIEEIEEVSLRKRAERQAQLTADVTPFAVATTWVLPCAETVLKILRDGNQEVSETATKNTQRTLEEHTERTKEDERVSRSARAHIKSHKLSSIEHRRVEIIDGNDMLGL